MLSVPVPVPGPVAVNSITTVFSGAPIRGVFIRAPWVESHAATVEILASIDVAGKSHPVAVRQGSVLATAFHPELTGDNRVHRYFLETVCKK